jgi:Ca2+-binding RTX toxin-like protein
MLPDPVALLATRDDLSDTDHSPPRLEWHNLSGSTPTVGVQAHVGLRFDEPVQRGSGLITLRTGSGQLVESFDIATSTRIAFNGQGVTIDLSRDLVPGQTYELEILHGRLLDAAGNSFDGEVLGLGLVDTSRALPLSGTRLDDALYGGKGNDQLTGGKGDDLMIGGDGQDTATYRGAFADYEISYDASAGRFLVRDRVAVRDGNDRLYAIETLQFQDQRVGISGPQEAPRLLTMAFAPKTGQPLGGADLELSFQEIVRPGGGSILLKSASGQLVETWTFEQADRLALDGGTLTINPNQDLVPGQLYRLELQDRAVRDLATRGNDPLSLSFAFTSPAGQTLDGGALPDRLFGGSGSDNLSGGGGADLIDAGGGNDTVRFSGSFSEYGVSYDKASGRYTVTDLRPGRDGIDTVLNAEQFRFADGQRSAESLRNPPLTLLSSSPADDATGVAADSPIQLVFNETLSRGSGTLQLVTADGRVLERYDVRTSSQLTLSGNSLSVKPGVALPGGTSVALVLPAGSLLDASGERLAELRVDFTLRHGNQALTGTNDVDELRGLDGHDKLSGGKGDDLLHGGGGDDTLQGDQNDDTAVYQGPARDYTVRYDARNDQYVVTDAVAGRDGRDTLKTMEFVRFADSTLPLESFKDTRSPSLLGLEPADGTQKVALTAAVKLFFSEDIQPGQGSITLRTSDGTLVESFDVSKSDRLVFSGSVLTVRPTLDLPPGSVLRLELASQAVLDLAGNSAVTSSKLGSYDFSTVNPGLRLDGGEGPDTLLGGDGDDVLNGGPGNDLMVGGKGDDHFDNADSRRGGGADRMEGGPGHDFYMLDDPGDQVVERPGEGNDAVMVPFDFSLLAWPEVEHLHAHGSRGLVLSGNTKDNQVIGGIGNDQLAGAAGADMLRGLAGDDRIDGGDGSDVALYSGNRADYAVRYDAATRSYTITDSRAGRDGVDTLISIEMVSFLDGMASTHLLAGLTTPPAPLLDLPWP